MNEMQIKKPHARFFAQHSGLQPHLHRAGRSTALHSEHAIAAAPCSHLGLRLLLLLLPLLLGRLLLVVLLAGILQPPLNLLKRLPTAQLGLNLLARASTKVSALQDK
jgi:hypothetical protein